jgi:nicotinamidase-related amidase
VQQTALELRWAGREVFVVADACGSRDPANRDLAFARMRAHGIDVVSREMVAFEWLQHGGSALFREVNRDFIR